MNIIKLWIIQRNTLLKKPNTENRAVLNCYTDESTTGNTLITAGAIVVASVATGAIIVPND